MMAIDPPFDEEASVRVLLVEDNIAIGNAVQDHLRAEGWEVDWTMDLASSIAAVASNPYDAIALDLRLPDGSGLDLLQGIATGVGSTPVIIMSAYDQLTDRMTGLGIGAVDYMVKPFSLSELVARMRGITGRPSGAVLPDIPVSGFSKAS